MYAVYVDYSVIIALLAEINDRWKFSCLWVNEGVDDIRVYWSELMMTFESTMVEFETNACAISELKTNEWMVNRRWGSMMHLHSDDRVLMNESEIRAKYSDVK